MDYPDHYAGAQDGLEYHLARYTAFLRVVEFDSTLRCVIRSRIVVVVALVAAVALVAMRLNVALASGGVQLNVTPIVITKIKSEPSPRTVCSLVGSGPTIAAVAVLDGGAS